MHINDKNPEHLMHIIATKATEAMNASAAGHDEHDHTAEDDAVGSVLTAKTVTMVTLCLVSICMGIIPMQIAKCFNIVSTNQVVNPRSFKYVSVLLGFGGGVLFSTTFLHMLPEVEEGVEHLMEEGIFPHLDFSLAKVFCCSGFFIMYLIEEIVHAHLKHRHPKRASTDTTSKTSSNVNIYSTESIDSYGSVAATPKWKAQGDHRHEETCEIGHTHLDIIEDCDSFHDGAIRGLLIVLGLSVHELFEGLAIGLESSAQYVWYMFGAVAAHKFIIAFCIGVELTTSRTRAVLSYVYVCMFAVVSPLGIGIGMILVGGNSAAASGPAAVALQGLASGTLLYVVFFEILHKHRDGLFQYLSIILGFLVMFGLQVLKMEVPVVTTQPTSSGPSATTILLLAKIGSMFVLGLGSLILGMLPLIIGRCRVKKSENRRAITSVSSASTTLTSASTLTVHSHDSTQGLLTSLLLCFGGGVLLFTTFLHLAPEVRASVELHQSNGQLANLGSLSLAELLFCCGFFFVYLVEEAVHAALTDKPESSETLLYRTVSVRRCNNNSGHPNNNTSSSGTSSAQRNSLSAQPRGWRTESSDAEEDCANETQQPKQLAPMFVLSQNSAAEVEAGGKPLVKDSLTGLNHTHAGSMRSLLTVLALSFHAIFEGLAVGLEPAFSSVVYLAAAIATHKLVISFCVGMELYVAGASNRTILGYLSVFSMVTPLGIGIGLALGHFRNDSETLGPTPTILQGMAAGTLLYVVFFEVLARERANEKSGLLQLAAILVGFMLMLGLQLATAHAHNHGHTHSHADEHGDIHNHEGEQLAGDKHNYVLGAAIERVTDKVVDVLSTTLT